MVRKTEVGWWDGSACSSSVCVNVVQRIFFSGGSGDILVKPRENIGQIYMAEITRDYTDSLWVVFWERVNGVLRWASA